VSLRVSAALPCRCLQLSLVSSCWRFSKDDTILPTAFLSYASEENGAPQDGVSRGWVDFFDECLSLELVKQRDDTTVWRDIRDLRRPGAITDGLREEVAKASVFLNVLSPRYGTKPYTQFELAQFLESRKPGERPGASILPLLIGPLDINHIPPPLRGLKYVSFFEINPLSKAVEPFFDGYGRKISNKYFDAVREVANFVVNRIKDQQGELASVRKGATVYLAAPGLDQMSNHWRIYNELESQKCQIAPVEPWPIEREKATDHLGMGLRSAKFSIHLLGAFSGVARRDDLTEFAAKQLDWAAAHQRQNPEFRRLIWIPPNLRDPDPGQKALIAGLDDGTLLTPHDELVRDGLEAFKEVIRDELLRVYATGAVSP
jgi:hypothetical protein